jgi:hypothetical protein
MAVPPFPQTVHLTPTADGVIICPQCQTRQTKALAAYQGITTCLRVKCRCGALFPILLDQRAYYREYVQLAGRYTQLATQHTGEIRIVNLSSGGVGFVTLTPSPLQVEDLIELLFCLDDPSQSVVYQRAVVKHVRDILVGAALCPLTREGQALARYLRAPDITLGG